jgi:cell fate regulator YaaT (PSP1 superfamily)
MTIVVGVRFKPATKTYFFDPSGVSDALHVGDRVIVETTRARELGRVVSEASDVSSEAIVSQLKPVLRKATAADLTNAEHFGGQEAEALQRCRERLVEYHLPAKLVKAEYNFDGSHLTFSFTSEQRIDFRDLVRDLARVFHTRIELRQVGVRDEAKLIRGIGPCGRELCCSTYLCEFIPVSIKMAKLQGLPLSPMEISGSCGRLLCCLTYENACYVETHQRMPRVGEIVGTADGNGKVIGLNAVKETVHVLLESGMTMDLPLDQVRWRGSEPATAGAVTQQPQAAQNLPAATESDED